MRSKLKAALSDLRLPNEALFHFKNSWLSLEEIPLKHGAMDIDVSPGS